MYAPRPVLRTSALRPHCYRNSQHNKTTKQPHVSQRHSWQIQPSTLSKSVGVFIHPLGHQAIQGFLALVLVGWWLCRCVGEEVRQVDARHLVLVQDVQHLVKVSKVQHCQHGKYTVSEWLLTPVTRRMGQSTRLELVSQDSAPVRPAAWQQTISCRHGQYMTTSGISSGQCRLATMAKMLFGSLDDLQGMVAFMQRTRAFIWMINHKALFTVCAFSA